MGGPVPLCSGAPAPGNLIPGTGVRHTQFPPAPSERQPHWIKCVKKPAACHHRLESQSLVFTHGYSSFLTVSSDLCSNVATRLDRLPVAMGGRRRGEHDENYSFVSPVVKYLLFLFNLIFWVISLVMVAIGVYARMMKHAEAALRCLSVDPAVMLLVVGVLMFILTFCGCVGSLRENICLLQTFCVCLTVIFLLQLVAGVLGFVFADKARNRVTVMINDAIVHYREDIDLQNLIDFGQKEFGCCGGVTYSDWSQNMYFSCEPDNPSRERCSVPFSCCVLNKDENVINTMCGQGMQEMEYTEAGNHIHVNGCIDKLVDWIHSNLFLLGGVALGLAIPQLVGILLSQVLISQIKDQIELQNYNLKHSSDPWR